MSGQPLRRGPGLRWWRWTVPVWAIVLGIALVAFLFEGALHSVHHLDSDEKAADCWVASAASAVSIVSPEVVGLDDVFRVAVALSPDPAPAAPAPRPLLAARGRAPPSALFA